MLSFKICVIICNSGDTFERLTPNKEARPISVIVFTINLSKSINCLFLNRKKITREITIMHPIIFDFACVHINHFLFKSFLVDCVTPVAISFVTESKTALTDVLFTLTLGLKHKCFYFLLSSKLGGRGRYGSASSVCSGLNDDHDRRIPSH